MNVIDRRSLLSVGAATVTTALAGCSGDGDGGSGESESSDSTDSSENSVFEKVQGEGTDLIVQFDSGTDVSKVNLISPDGSQYSSSSVAAGESKITLGLVDSDEVAPSGEYQLVAVGEEIEQSQTVTLEPNLSAIGGSLPALLPRADEYEDWIRNTAPVVAIENTGNMPAVLTDSAVTGDVPLPRQPPESSDQPRSFWDARADDDLGLAGFDHEKGSGTFKRSNSELVVPTGQTVLVQLDYYPWQITSSVEEKFRNIEGYLDTSRVEEEFRNKSVEGTVRLFDQEGTEITQKITVRYGGEVNKTAVIDDNGDAYEYHFFLDPEVTNTEITND